jgi:hypothetical protein
MRGEEVQKCKEPKNPKQSKNARNPYEGGGSLKYFPKK